jgi:hypothetical protein
MKTTRLTKFLIVPVIMALAGCGKPAATTPAAAPPPAATPVPAEKGTIQTAVEGFTGKTSVDAGMRARDQIKAASETRNRNLEDAGQ